MRKTIKDRHNAIKQTGGTSKLEAYHKNVNKLLNGGTMGIRRAENVIGMYTLDFNYKQMVQFDNRWPEHLRVAFHMQPIIAAVAALELRTFADASKRKLPLYPLLDIHRNEDRMIFGWQIDQITMRDEYDNRQPPPIEVPEYFTNAPLSLLTDVLDTTSNTDSVRINVERVLSRCPCLTSVCCCSRPQSLSLSLQSPSFGRRKVRDSTTSTTSSRIKRNAHSKNKSSRIVDNVSRSCDQFIHKYNRLAPIINQIRQEILQ